MREIIWGRYSLLVYSGFFSAVFLISSFYFLLSFPFFLFTFLLFLISLKDFLQKKRSVLSNFPLLGRFRFFLESIRPELRQYYWEADDEELPYSRNQRSMVWSNKNCRLGLRQNNN